jgi:hypothetical protein
MRALILVFTLAAAAASGAAADIIDRVFAVVDGQLITQSDVEGVIRLGLITVPPTGDPVAFVLDRLIERRLILEEVDRYAPADPAEADVDRALDAVRARVGSTTALNEIFAQSGGSEDQLRRFLRDDLRIQAYVQQRFGLSQPSDAEIAQYYQDHPDRFGGRTLQQAHAAVLSELQSERRTTVVADWVAALRRRANINVLPRQ